MGGPQIGFSLQVDRSEFRSSGLVEGLARAGARAFPSLTESKAIMGGASPLFSPSLTAGFLFPEVGCDLGCADCPGSYY